MANFLKLHLNAEIFTLFPVVLLFKRWTFLATNKIFDHIFS
jgi:hypothetical protein